MASTKVMGTRIRCHVIKIWPMGMQDFWCEGTWQDPRPQSQKSFGGRKKSSELFFSQKARLVASM
jgi:hypothetical protein